ncbi:hypothetical protein KEM48_005175 [Puccinia striiformis f. sp. tritici PST-130]|nr:hypothetical protein KEM48_005175 [Puccinia striiformis f. sp. tritici PST-130]
MRRQTIRNRDQYVSHTCVASTPSSWRPYIYAMFSRLIIALLILVGQYMASETPVQLTQEIRRCGSCPNLKESYPDTIHQFEGNQAIESHINSGMSSAEQEKSLELVCLDRQDNFNSHSQSPLLVNNDRLVINSVDKGSGLDYESPKKSLAPIIP